MTFFFLTAYQFVAIYTPAQKTVFGISIVYLSLNCLIMMFLVFMNSAVRNSSIMDFIASKVPSAQQIGKGLPDPRRQTDF
jgi:hypothetical protein